MRIFLFYLLTVAGFLSTAQAQKLENYWSFQPLRVNSTENWPIVPDQYQVAVLSFENFYQNIISRDGEISRISIPTPEGNVVGFNVSKNNVFEDNLSKKFPGYFSYYGSQVNNSGVKIALSVSPFSMHVMVHSNQEETYFIDPVTLDNSGEYLIYYKKDLPKPHQKKWFCKQPEIPEIEFTDLLHSKNNPVQTERAGDCRLRTYRLALACTGEYGLYHGGTVEKVLAAFNTAVTRVNAVYRKEIGIFFRLVDNVDKLIFFNPSSDPYSNNDSEAMLSQNQSTVDQIIGRANYDIGHVFGTGDGGIASLGSVCSANRKAQGVTGRPNPVGDAFFIDYVAHEIGHQFRANHTQNNNCQRNGPTAVEPGSGSTIMGYAGICMPNVQNSSNDYFHTISLSEISSFILGNPGCGSIENLGNSKPALTIDKNSYTIPISTPFYLTAKGSDADENNLTYTWEQMNNETATMPPRATNTTGPMFRSVSPTTMPTRYFPDLRGRFGQWEVLPSVTRTMNFRGTVRDNSDLGGCTTEANVIVNTNISSGPFIVTQPNTPTVIWEAGNTATVTWNVANTNLSPVLCNEVDIYLSIDGGTNYSMILAKSLPNSGTANILVPNTPTNQARVMVVASDNIFYDISNFSFTIKSSIQITIVPDRKEICANPTNFPFSIQSLQNGENHALNFELVESPANVEVFFPQTITTFPVDDTIRVNVNGVLTKGIYPVIFKITDAQYVVFDTIYLVSRGQENDPLHLLLPENGRQFSQGTPLALLQWQKDIVDNYMLQVSTHPSFADSITQTLILQKNSHTFFGGGKMYFWRVRPMSDCAEFPWSEVFVFNMNGKTKYTDPLLRNNGLVVEKSGVKEIRPSHLSIAYEEQKEYFYQIIETTEQGVLIKGKGTDAEILSAGGIFTSTDIKNGNISYAHSGSTTSFDAFTFFIENPDNWLAPLHFSIFILQDTGFAAFIEIEQDIQCKGDQALIRFEVNNGTPPYEYSPFISGTFKPLDNILTEVSEGPHIYLVRDSEHKTFTTNRINITSPPKLLNDTEIEKYDIVINSNGGAGFSRMYSFDGINFSFDNILKDPPNDKYFTFVRDVNQCLAADSVILAIDPLRLDSLIFTDSLTCFTDQAIVSAYVTGGIPPYSIFLNGVKIVESTFYTNPGIYTFTITDSGEKSISRGIEIFSPDPIITNINVDRRDVFWSPSGGNPPYEYSFDDVQFFFDDFALDLANGMYTLIVKDAKGCKTEEKFNISILETVSIDIKSPPCFGQQGSILITPENGTPPLKYGINKEELDTLTILSGLSGGAYVLYVVDALGDSIEQSFEILEPDSLILDFDIRYDTLTILVSGGVAPYQYSVDGGFTFFPFNRFYSVPEGTYNILIRDANGCIKSRDVVITYSSAKDISGKDFVNIYPNPVSDNLTLVFNTNNEYEIGVTLMDVLGKSLFSESVYINQRRIKLSLESVHTGTYFLIINDKSGTRQFKIVKL